MSGTFTGFVERAGYLATALFIAAEGIGIPLPGETVLVSAAALAGRGNLSLWGVIAAGTIGAIAGGSAGYWIGRLGGLRLINRWGKYLHITPDKLSRAHGFFARHGAMTVFLGRFIAILRVLAFLIAGIAEMPFGQFFVVNALGGFVWSFVFSEIGYTFGRNMHRLHAWVGIASIVFGTLAIAGLLAWLVTHKFRQHRHTIARTVELRTGQLARSGPMRALRDRHPRAWRWIAAKAARGEYLTVHLGAGLLVCMGALWGFSAINGTLLRHDPLARTDFALLKWARLSTTPLGENLGLFFSALGGPYVVLALAALVSLWLVMRRKPLLLGGWLGALVGASVLDAVLLRVLHRPEPVNGLHLLYGLALPFPSAYATGSVVAWGMLAYMLIRTVPLRRRWRTTIVISVIVLVGAIGISRIALGVHFLSEVLAGWSISAMWLAVCASGLEVALKERVERIEGAVRDGD